MVPYPAKTYKRFLICIAAPSRRGTGAGGIFSHFNSGAGKSAKVADSTLSDTFSLLSPACLSLLLSALTYKSWTGHYTWVWGSELFEAFVIIIAKQSIKWSECDLASDVAHQHLIDNSRVKLKHVHNSIQHFEWHI